MSDIRAASSTGALVPSSHRLLDTDLYAEVGVLGRLGLVADLALARAVWQPLPSEPSAFAAGLSDATVGAKILVFDDDLTLSLYTGVTFPTGSTREREPLGEGDTRVEIALLAGRLFERWPIFVDGRLGVAFRGESDVTDPRAPSTTMHVVYAPEVRYAAEVGYGLFAGLPGLRKLTLAAKCEGAYGTGARVEDGVGLLTPSSKAYVKLGPAISWRPWEHVELATSAGVFALGAATPRLVEVAVAVAVAF